MEIFFRSEDWNDGVNNYIDDSSRNRGYRRIRKIRLYPSEEVLLLDRRRTNGDTRRGWGIQQFDKTIQNIIILFGCITKFESCYTSRKKVAFVRRLKMLFKSY